MATLNTTKMLAAAAQSMRTTAIFAIAWCMHFAALAQGALAVRFSSMDAGVELQAWYYRADTAAKAAPAIVALHGCGGMLNRQGQPNERTQSYAQLLNQQGWNVLFVDSLRPRGFKSVCGNSAHTIAPAGRVVDVQAAVAWLAQRGDVDRQRIGILGWSHGGSVTLLANAAGVEYAVPPKAALAFYPGCGPLSLPRQWQPGRSILMQLGQDDDWTDPQPCQALAQAFPERMAQDTYPDSGHGFDSDAPRREVVLNAGTRHQRTVHTGGNALANQQAKARLVAYFQQHFQVSN